MAIAALGIELERRWGADDYEPGEEPAADRKAQAAVLSRQGSEGKELEAKDATETTDDPADEEPIGKPRQRHSSAGADGASLLARSSEATGAQTLGDKQGSRTAEPGDQANRTNTASMGLIGRGGGRGEVSAKGAATTTAASTTSSSGVQISGTFLAGPVVSQNTIGIRAYSEDGVLLATTGVNSDGSYSLTLPEGYTGYVLIEAVDLDPATPDYVDERTKTAQNLTTSLRTIGYIGGVNQTLHINPITEIATQKLGLAEGSNAFKGLSLSQAVIDAAEQEIAKALGIPTDFMSGTAPISTISTAGEFVSGVSDAYGIVLAAISGAEFGSTTSAVLKAIAQGISSRGLDQTANTMLVNGATLADSSLGEKMLLRQKSGQQTLSYSASNILPLVIAPPQKINDTPIGKEQSIFWPGIGTAKITVSNQPGVITDAAVAVVIESLGDNRSGGTLYLTLISPEGVRVPIAGTGINPAYQAYDENYELPEIFELKAREIKSLLISETAQSRDNFAINESIAELLSSESSKPSLSTLTALNGTESNGEWQLEVRNSRGDSVKLHGWQLFLKTAELNTATDSDGEYDFSRLGSSTTSGALTPWITAPDNRAILSPAGGLNAKTGLSTALSQISFGLSTADEGPLPQQADAESWSRIDQTSLINPTSLHPANTLNQAVTALTADAARAKYGVDGTGLKIGIISDSFNKLGGVSYDVQKGLLPEQFLDPVYYKSHVLEVNNHLLQGGAVDDAEDEGRAMMQLAMSIAPGAEYYFSAGYDKLTKEQGEKMSTSEKTEYTLYQPKEMASRIDRLVEKGCKIIVDDLYFVALPFFQDDPVSEAIRRAQDAGVTYFTAATNSSNYSYESEYRPELFTPTPGIPDEISKDLVNRYAHNFGDPENPVYYQKITGGIPDKEIVLGWDEPWGKSNKSLKLHIYDRNLKKIDSLSTPGYPIELAAPNTGEFYIAVSSDSDQNNPGHMKWVYFVGGASGVKAEPSDDYYASTAVGHSNPPAGASVAAVDYWSTPAYRSDKTYLSNFSSWGVTPIYFDAEGNRLEKPEERKQPLLSAPQYGDTSFFGGDDPDSNGLTNFSGTSAAAPNAAGVAALMLQLNPNLTPTQIFDALKATATPVTATGSQTKDGFNNASGYGLINAMAALDHIAQFSISGTVYEDSNADGQQNAGELGLEGIQVFLDSNGNGRFDQNNTWQSFLATASGGESGSAATKPTLVVDSLTGLLIDSRYETVFHGTDSLSSNTPLSESSLLISSITSSSDYDVITEGGRDLTLNGDLLLHFDGASRTTAGSYSILKANSISGSFDNILIEGLSDALYFGIGIEGGDNIQVTVSKDYFVGSTKAGSLF